MTVEPPTDAQMMANVTVHYWAAAKNAAGIGEEHVAAPNLADLIDQIAVRHAENPRFGDVIAMCSVLIGQTPVGARDHATVALADGDTIEFLPPFAGG